MFAPEGDSNDDLSSDLYERYCIQTGLDIESDDVSKIDEEFAHFFTNYHPASSKSSQSSNNSYDKHIRPHHYHHTSPHIKELAISEVNLGSSQVQVAEKYGIRKSTLQSWMYQRATHIDVDNKHNITIITYKDEIVLVLIIQYLNLVGIPVTPSFIIKSALNLFSAHHPQFKASRRWL